LFLILVTQFGHEVVGQVGLLLQFTHSMSEVAMLSIFALSIYLEISTQLSLALVIPILLE